MAKRTRKTSIPKAPAPTFSVEAAKLHLTSLVQVDFGLAWEPKEGAYVIVRSVKVNGAEIPGATGGTNHSGYHVPLGQHPAGAQLRVEWSVESYNDLIGIAAFIRTSTTPDWKQLGPQKAPLAFKEVWTSSESYTVT